MAEVPVDSEQQHVLVELDDGTVVPGLVLKSRSDGERALVTYEVAGKVATDWIGVARLRPMAEPPEPVGV